jgi:hypothetical protein
MFDPHINRIENNFVQIFSTYMRVYTVHVITFKEMSGGINPESVNSQIEPEGKNLFEQSHNFGVVKVEVGLFGVELMKVVLPACLIKSPSRPTKHTSLKIEN